MTTNTVQTNSNIDINLYQSNADDQLALAFSLIDDCQFNQKNPFDVTIDIINNDPELPKFLHNKFIEQAYKTWMHHEYDGEGNGAMVYKFILDKIKNKNVSYFKELESSQLQEIHDLFEKTIIDEVKHDQIAKYLSKKIGYNFVPNESDPYKAFALYFSSPRLNPIDFDSEESILIILFYNYICEVIVLGFIVLISKYINNVKKKNLLKIIAQDEARHVHEFFKLIKTIRKNINQIDLDRLDNMFKTVQLHYEYFGIFNLYNFFDYCYYNLDKSDPQRENLEKKFFNVIANNNFQKEYKSYVNDKIYEYYSFLFPHVSKNEFNEIVENKISMLLKKLLEKTMN
jgi:hypothetical protein